MLLESKGIWKWSYSLLTDKGSNFGEGSTNAHLSKIKFPSQFHSIKIKYIAKNKVIRNGPCVLALFELLFVLFLSKIEIYE